MTQLTILYGKGLGSVLVGCSHGPVTVDIDETLTGKVGIVRQSEGCKLGKREEASINVKLPAKRILRSRVLGSSYEELAWNGEGNAFHLRCVGHTRPSEMLR